MPKNKKGINHLEIIKASKNVRAACQALGISRSQYYKLLKNPEPAAPKPYKPLKMGDEAVAKIHAVKA